MNDQLQQFLNLQQALAAAATAAIFNTIQQAANIAATTPPNATTNVLTDTSISDLQQQLQDSRQSPLDESISPLSTAATVGNAPNLQNSADCNAKIQELLLQLGQQANVGQSPLALNLNLLAQQQQQQQQQTLDSPINHSPLSRLTAQDFQQATATTSNNQQSTNQISPNKKLKRQHHSHSPAPQAFHNRSLDATSKPHNTPPKSISNLNNSSGSSRHTGISNSGSSSSSAFIANSVSLPRKLVRGQDVWLGRGPEQTRQIFKCMWCGTSFRTLDEMAEHMRITKHHTNLVSPEQITSWKQHGNTSSSSKHSKQQQIQARSTNEELNQDELSEKYDSDRDSTFNNDEDLNQSSRRTSYQQVNKQEMNNKINNSSEINSKRLESSQAELQKLEKQQQNSATSTKPLTRSRKRESDTVPSKRDGNDRENSPATSSSSQKQLQSPTNSCASNLILGDLNEDSKINKEHSKLNGSSQNSLEKAEGGSSSSDEQEEKNRELNDDDEASFKSDTKNADDQASKVTEIDISREKLTSDGLSAKKGAHGDTNNDEHENGNEGKEEEREDEQATEKSDEDAVTNAENDEDNVEGADNDTRDNDKTSEIDESTPATSAATATSGAKSSHLGQKGETGDPLSALETMVEKSFDPRLRPGVANGGILQRLGIDEEVCPPWQHINYANWYAAAAYSHPMAAALLAAGMNLQNGMKFSKNLGSKKNDD